MNSSHGNRSAYTRFGVTEPGLVLCFCYSGLSFCISKVFLSEMIPSSYFFIYEASVLQDIAPFMEIFRRKKKKKSVEIGMSVLYASYLNSSQIFAFLCSGTLQGNLTNCIFKTEIPTSSETNYVAGHKPACRKDEC